MIRIMFVCHGNICRSPMAEFVLRDMVQKQGLADRISVASSATSTEEIGNPVHRGTKQKLQEMGIPMTERRAVQLQKRDYADYDYLIAMDSRNVRNMLRIVGADTQQKISRLLDGTAQPRDIADPWYTGNFDETYADIREGCEALLKKLLY